MPQWPFLTIGFHTGSSVYKVGFLGRRALGNIRLPLCQARVKILYISITPIAPRETEACCGLNDSVQPHPTSPLYPLLEQLMFPDPSEDQVVEDCSQGSSVWWCGLQGLQQKQYRLGLKDCCFFKSDLFELLVACSLAHFLLPSFTQDYILIQRNTFLGSGRSFQARRVMWKIIISKINQIPYY